MLNERRSPVPSETQAPAIPAIVGPTASGKSTVALLLADHLQGEIVSADSRQIYKYLDIGTAKPTSAERQRIVHHFIDFLEPSAEYSAGEFGPSAVKVINGILGRGKMPILVGGSGLYVRAAIDGLWETPTKDPEIRERLSGWYRAEGLEPLLNRLKVVDPGTLKRMKEVNPRRVIRALEICEATGKPLSQAGQTTAPASGFTVVQFAFDWERRGLYEVINERVGRMLDEGLIEEVERLKSMGLDRRLNSLNTVGYKEVFDHLDGLTSRPEMTELIKRNTRRFAKRQLTWFKADKRISWLPMSVDTDIARLLERMESRFASHPTKKLS